jgi:hypothetical protein
VEEVESVDAAEDMVKLWASWAMSNAGPAKELVNVRLATEPVKCFDKLLTKFRIKELKKERRLHNEQQTSSFFTKSR